MSPKRGPKWVDSGGLGSDPSILYTFARARDTVLIPQIGVFRGIKYPSKGVQRAPNRGILGPKQGLQRGSKMGPIPGYLQIPEIGISTFKPLRSQGPEMGQNGVRNGTGLGSEMGSKMGPF